MQFFFFIGVGFFFFFINIFTFFMFHFLSLHHQTFEVVKANDTFLQNLNCKFNKNLLIQNISIGTFKSGVGYLTNFKKIY